MLWIISGPTSAGKSTFIASPRAFALTGLPPECPVLWPSMTLQLSDMRMRDAFFHYNILRSVAPKHWPAELAGQCVEAVTLEAIRFDRDRRWIELLDSHVEKKAIVLVAGKQTLVQRIEQRSINEEPDLSGREAKDYPTTLWLRLMEQVDLPALYAA
jgi:hypothetical protein